ncbi:MAG: hypothetical protein ABJC39_04750 [Chloroflexota bacterium]
MTNEWQAAGPQNDPFAIDALRNRRRRFKERARTEYLKGVEEKNRRLTGRPMTAAELQQALRRYPGDR